MVDKTRLNGKTAIVTGGAQGIGREVAILLAERGEDVAIWDIKAEGAKETAELVQKKGRRAIAQTVDVTASAQVNPATERVAKELGHVDILVNVAGGTYGAPQGLKDLTEEDWD